MSFEFSDDIIHEMFNRTFSIFCGAGANCDATNQNWDDIFSDVTKQFYINNCSKDLYLLSDLEKRYYNNSFIEDITEKINGNSQKESEHINNIIDLNINQIWTTNYETIIENTIKRKLGVIPTVIKESKDLFTKNLNSKFIIYKLNGSIEKVDTMILTKSDYFNYFKKQRLFFEVLKRQFILDSFLFVGYSFADDLVLSALREIKEMFPNRGKFHYTFNVKKENDTKQKEEYQKYLEQYYFNEYKIKTIHVEDYTDIDKYLKNIYNRFCNKNVFIAGSFRYLQNNDERKNLEDLVDTLIYKLVLNNYNIYSGNGRGLGEIVVAQVNKHNVENHFVNRPFIFSGDNEKQKEEKNKLIMKDCDIMIIIAGQDDSLEASKNVYKQFQFFMNESSEKRFKLIIPIPSTGYAAEKIFSSDIFRNSNVYKNNKEIFEKLNYTKDINEIINIIINIIKSYKVENS